MGRSHGFGEVTQLVECHLVEVKVGGSNPLFLTNNLWYVYTPPWWNGRHSRLKICILLVRVRQEVRTSFAIFAPMTEW